MMGVVDIIDTDPSHIRELALTMREADQREIVSAGFTPKSALWRSYRESIYRKTALVDNRVAACWGVTGNLFGGKGVPWLLTSSHCELVSPLVFARIYKKETKTMLRMFPTLVNYVDASYTEAVRLLEICGFQLDDPEQFGRNGALFHRFELRIAVG